MGDALALGDSPAVGLVEAEALPLGEADTARQTQPLKGAGAVDQQTSAESPPQPDGEGEPLPLGDCEGEALPFGVAVGVCECGDALALTEDEAVALPLTEALALAETQPQT